MGLQRRDIILQEPVLTDKLHRQGMLVNHCDIDSFRTKLTPYYGRWKTEFGATFWALLEQAVGKLG